MSNLETIETVLWRSSGRIFSTVSTVLRPIFSVRWTVSGGTQREYSSKPHKHSIVERTLVFKR